jgi:hypothetical protein
VGRVTRIATQTEVEPLVARWAAMIARHVDVAERRARLAVRHLLAPGAAAPDAPTVVAALGGALHATDPTTPHIAVFMRLRQPARDDLDRIVLEERSVVRHHAMRRTLWILDVGLAGAAHDACTRALAVREWTQFATLLRANGVDDPETWIDGAQRRALEVIGELGVCTARELGVAAPELAVPLAVAPGKSYAGTQGAHTRLVQNLGFDGAIVRTESVGSWVGGEFRWVISDDWIPGGFVRPESNAGNTAGAELATAYLRSFGPATTTDLQWWAGWTASATRRALDAVGAVPVTVDGEDGGAPTPAWLLPDDLDAVDTPDTWATLLPSLDPTVMGWKQRQWYAGEHGRFGHTVFDRNGNAGNSIVADGVVVGTWAHRLDGSVAVQYLEAVTTAHRNHVDDSIDRYLVGVADTVVRPRYPAPLQRDLMAPGDWAPNPSLR